MAKPACGFLKSRGIDPIAQLVSEIGCGDDPQHHYCNGPWIDPAGEAVHWMTVGLIYGATEPERAQKLLDDIKGIWREWLTTKRVDMHLTAVGK